MAHVQYNINLHRDPAIWLLHGMQSYQFEEQSIPVCGTTLMPGLWPRWHQGVRLHLTRLLNAVNCLPPICAGAARPPWRLALDPLERRIACPTLSWMKSAYHRLQAHATSTSDSIRPNKQFH